MDLLEKAVEKRAALAAEMARLDNFIRTAKELMADASTLHMTLSGHSETLGSNGGAHIPNKTKVLNACREIIAQRKVVPLKTLLRELDARGITPGTRKPAIALSVMLSRSDEFQADRKKGGWSIVKNYAPSGANH
jgi:alkylhydroperoxidase/carboxymuconolactone decarboxylase family protein YurZ